MRRNRMDYDDYDYGYDRDRPLLQGKTYRKELAKASETFKQELNVNGINFSRSLDAGRAYAESMHQQAGGDPLCDDALVNHGPFTLFLVLWFKVFPEEPAVHDARLAMNHVRHNVLSYTDMFAPLRAKYWVGDDFACDLWCRAQYAIVDYWQRCGLDADTLKACDVSTAMTNDARTFYFMYHMNAKAFVKERGFSYGDTTYEELIDMLDGIAEDHNELDWRRRKLINKRKETQWNAYCADYERRRKVFVKDRVEASKALTALWRPLFKNHDPVFDTLTITRGRTTYPLEITKINRSKIAYRFMFKNGNIKEATMYASTMLKLNPTLPKPDGYDFDPDSNPALW